MELVATAHQRWYAAHLLLGPELLARNRCRAYACTLICSLAMYCIHALQRLESRAAAALSSQDPPILRPRTR